MRPSFAFALFAAALALAACNGPKETCEGSMNSYYALLKSHDWDGAYEMLTPEYKRKLTADRYARGMEEEWLGSKGFSLKVGNISESRGACYANGGISYTVKIRGKEPVDYDNEYFSWIFRKQADGKWYIEMPGMERVSAY